MLCMIMNAAECFLELRMVELPFVCASHRRYNTKRARKLKTENCGKSFSSTITIEIFPDASNIAANACMML